MSSTGGVRKKLFRLRPPKTHKQQQNLREDQDPGGSLEQDSRKLVLREEQLFGRSLPTEEEQEVLQEEHQNLKVHILDVFRTCFLSSLLSSSSVQLQALNGCISALVQQEEQDELWRTRPQHRVPAWRPLLCLRAQNGLISSLMEDRLDRAERQTDGHLETDVRKRVMQLGQRVQEDLLGVARCLQEAYRPYMDILNIWAGLYHQELRGRITALISAGLEEQHDSFLLHWVKERYTQEVLGHPHFDGQVNTSSLGSLLLPYHMTTLEERYLSNKQHTVAVWLRAALLKEEQTWICGAPPPEVLDGFFFSPLAVDVIQVIDSSLTELRCVVTDPTHSFLFHLEDFLTSYLHCIENLLKSNNSNTHSVIKAQLVCEQQLRDYITAPGVCVNSEDRRRCEDTLSVVKDQMLTFLNSPVLCQLKVYLRPLWTSVWVDGSLPVVDSVIESVSRQLTQLTDLKPSCRQTLLSVLCEDVLLLFVKKTLKTVMRSREQQVAGAYRLIQDAEMIDSFFTEEGLSEGCRFSSVLCCIAEFLRLEETDAVTSQLDSLRRHCPDLSENHVSVLLSLKIGQSAAAVRAIRQSLAGTLPPVQPTNHCPPLFSRVRVTWKHNKLVKLVKLGL